MPASPGRKAVMLRLTDDAVKDLDKLCAEYSSRLGYVIHRSGLVEHLVGLGISEIKSAKKNGKQAAPHWVPPPRPEA